MQKDQEKAKFVGFSFFIMYVENKILNSQKAFMQFCLKEKYSIGQSIHRWMVILTF